jgi:Cof subfamily protein (haloacid dehalogenase superfamily)
MARMTAQVAAQVAARVAIRLIACDLDGTLMGEDLEFSPRLLCAMRRAQERGITVTIATGRGLPSTRQFAQRLNITAPLVCYQGAQVRLHDGTFLYQANLPRAYLPEVIAFCRDRRRELTVYYDDQIYQATQGYDPAYYDRWFSLPRHLVGDLLTDLPGEPAKFLAIAASREDGDRLEEEVRALAARRFQVVRSHAWFVEGLASGVSKGNGLSRLAQHLGIRREEVMALGDSGNDASMIDWAGLGVAVGNASADVKAVADVIAPPLAEDGAAWAIERYALGGRPN